MVEVGKIRDRTLVLNGGYISIFRGGKLVWKEKYMAYLLPDGNSYIYRRRVRITEQSGKTLTDYQIRIEIGAGDPIFAHARSAGEDIRFCYHPEEEMLSYWIEKYDPDAEEAIIWVKVPEIPANSEIEIYMYYGNPDVASASDGEATFEFFDDFEGTSLDTNKWDIASGSPTVSDGWLNLQGAVIHSKFTYLYGAMRAKVDVIDASWWDIAGANNGAGDLLSYRRRIAGGEWHEIRNENTASDNSLTMITGIHIVEHTWLPNEAKLYRNNNLESTLTTNVPDEAGYVEFISGDTNPLLRVDWVFVRKYTSPEPSVSVGAEE